MNDEPYLGVVTRIGDRRPPLPRWRIGKDGRWRVRIACPDGLMRTFVATRHAARGLADAEVVKRRDGIGPRLRWDVLEQGGFRCRYCGRGPADVTLEVDHLTSVADGGSNDPGNLGIACWDCNIGKGERSVDVAVDVTAAADPARSA